MSMKARVGKRLAKRKRSYQPATNDGDSVEEKVHRARLENRRG
jgi:hypothetical protein